MSCSLGPVPVTGPNKKCRTEGNGCGLSYASQVTANSGKQKRLAAAMLQLAVPRGAAHHRRPKGAIVVAAAVASVLVLVVVVVVMILVQGGFKGLGELGLIGVRKQSKRA